MIHRRYFQLGGLTIEVESGIPMSNDTFHPAVQRFRVDGSGEDKITIRHHFSLPRIEDWDLGEEVYRKSPWAIYKNNDSWIYVGISARAGDTSLHRVVVFNHDYTDANVYNPDEEAFRQGGLHCVTLFPSDQIHMAQVLAHKSGCYVHACGVILDGKGLLFVGHADAGKSTMATMLRDRVEILCDDRMIVRRREDGFRIYGTWSHGDIPDVSPSSAPLRAIMFLEQAANNRLTRLHNRPEIVKKLLPRLIKPFETVDWWTRTMDLAEHISREVPCHTLEFDRSGDVVDLLEDL